MMKRECERCRYFAAAQSRMEKPTWGHCLWGVPEAEQGDPLALGRFIWADDSCEHFQARRRAAAAT
jgi:hypothetical protein